MPVTLDTALNQDSVAFVEMIDQLHVDYFTEEQKKFGVRDIFLYDDWAEVIYANDFWRGTRLSVYAEDSTKGSVVLIIDGTRYLNGIMFYSGEVDSLYLKTCRAVPSKDGIVSLDIEIFNAYWENRIAYRVKSNDTLLFDEKFNLKAKTSEMRAFIPDERTRVRLQHFAKPLIERSKRAADNNRNFSQPGSAGKRNR